MKKLVLIALFATAGLTQLAHASGGYISYCPEGTYRTPVGHCQPDFDFD
ncbi:hypothetical protein [Pseudomonas sichuanensis]|uniref:Uncharacterized protein n=1 Tax=Pseudomonas sichuanensis TaxID=2213015 RepID=A0ABV0DLA2_9PSED